MIDRRVLPLLLGLSALFSACKKPAVETYRVPKEAIAEAPAPKSATPAASGAAAAAPAPKAPMAGGNAMANTAVATAGGPGLTWTAPAHWTVKPGSAMRKGSYAIKAEGIAGEGDLSITAFPGDVGGDLANINRWRGQIQLPPISSGQLEAALQRTERNGLRIAIVDLAGTGANAQRTLAAMIPYEGSTWFVKLTGPDAIVSKEKAAFAAFIDTIKPSAAAK